MIKLIRPFIIIMVALVYASSGAQNAPDNLDLTNHLKPISAENIFKTEGYYNWGTSILKGDDGKYHMFYSRWKKDYGFYGWLTHSEIAHAVSDHPAGPWTYLETALQGPRENQVGS